MLNKLNKSNPISWFGAFTDKPFVINAGNVNENIVINSDSIVFAPLINSTSTYDIDLNSVEITMQDNNSFPAIYDPIENKITYYPPSNIAVGEVRELKFKFYDIAGHVSNEGTAFITVLDRLTGWRGYTPSLLCRKDISNDNTGQAYYQQLEKYYLDNNTAYIPQALKNNTSGQPDFIADFQNYNSCPTPSTLGLILVYNQVNQDDLRIQQINFNPTSAGGSAQFYLNLTRSDPQPFQANLVPGTYDIDIIIDFVTHGGSTSLSSNITASDTSGFNATLSIDYAGHYFFTGFVVDNNYSGTINVINS